MINLAAYRLWLEARIQSLDLKGLVIEIVSNDAPPNPAIAVLIHDAKIAAQFSVWETGEADVDILVGRKFVNNVWGRIVADDSVKAAFEEFVSDVTRYAAK